MLFDHLKKFSKRTALISENLEKLSYSGLISRADKIASQVSKKSLVFILCENNIDSIVAYVGFIRSGNTVCLFDQNINDELLKRIINLYQPSFIFSNKKKKSRFWSFSTPLWAPGSGSASRFGKNGKNKDFF